MGIVTFPKKLTGEVRSLIMQAVYEALSDPDLGLELSEKARVRLRKAKLSKSKGIPFPEIRNKYK